MNLGKLEPASVLIAGLQVMNLLASLAFCALVAEAQQESQNPELVSPQLVPREGSDQQGGRGNACASAEDLAQAACQKRTIMRRMATLLERAYMGFDQKRFDRVIMLCDELLLIDPHYAIARELREDALKTWRKEEYYNIVAKGVEEWKKLTDDDDKNPVTPFSQTVRFPSWDEWLEISKRIAESEARFEEGLRSEADPGSSGRRMVLELHDIREVLPKLRSLRLGRSEPLHPDDEMGFAIEEAGVEEFVRNNVATGSWSGDRTIERTPNQQLLINQTFVVQREIQDFLAVVRSFDADMREQASRLRLKESIRRLRGGSACARRELEKAGPVAILALKEAIVEQESDSLNALYHEVRGQWEGVVKGLLEQLDDDDIAVRCRAAADLIKIGRSMGSAVDPRLASPDANNNPELVGRCRDILTAVREVRLPDLLEYWKTRRPEAERE